MSSKLICYLNHHRLIAKFEREDMTNYLLGQGIPAANLSGHSSNQPILVNQARVKT